jgi:hypothetical protein
MQSFDLSFIVLHQLIIVYYHFLWFLNLHRSLTLAPSWPNCLFWISNNSDSCNSFEFSFVFATILFPSYFYNCKDFCIWIFYILHRLDVCNKKKLYHYISLIIQYKIHATKLAICNKTIQKPSQLNCLNGILHDQISLSYESSRIKTLWSLSHEHQWSL